VITGPRGACWLNLHELVADLPAPGALQAHTIAEDHLM
jgi:hypothetical protein